MDEAEVRKAFHALRGRRPMQRIAPESIWDAALSESVGRWRPGSSDDAKALQSGLLLWNDDLDRSHSLSQDIETATGSLLHGIMHRMEGDYDNADYWFRLAGAHPCYPAVAGAASRLAEAAAPSDSGAVERLASPYIRGGSWDPHAFNQAVRQALAGREHPAFGLGQAWLESLQHAEMEVVINYCFAQCFGGTLLD